MNSQMNYLNVASLSVSLDVALVMGLVAAFFMAVLYVAQLSMWLNAWWVGYQQRRHDAALERAMRQLSEARDRRAVFARQSHY